VPAPAFPLTGEPLAVDLANTLVSERGRPADLLGDDEALRAWVRLHRAELPAGEQLPPLARVRALREAVRGLLEAAADGREPRAEDQGAVNRALAEAPAPRLAWDGGRFVQAAAEPGPADGAALLAVLARSAVETLTGGDAQRIRRCAGTGCILLFVATNPRRSFCSAELCGTRSRVARHRQRRRGERRA